MKYLLAFLLLASVSYADGPYTRSKVAPSSASSIASGTAIPAGGTATQIQYNSGGLLAGAAGTSVASVVSGSDVTISGSLTLTRGDGTTLLTLARTGANATTWSFNTNSGRLTLVSGSSIPGLAFNATGMFLGNNNTNGIATSVLHVSGTALVTGGVSFTGLATGTATNNVCLTASGAVISTSTLSGCLGVSDPALKKDIRPLPYGLAEVMAIDPVMYKDIRPGGFPGDQVGFLAYSVDRGGQRYRGLEPVMPELVDQKATFYNGKWYKGIPYDRIPATLVNAIKQQQAEIDELRQHAGLPPKYTTFGSRLKWLVSGE